MKLYGSSNRLEIRHYNSGIYVIDTDIYKLEQGELSMFMEAPAGRKFFSWGYYDDNTVTLGNDDYSLGGDVYDLNTNTIIHSYKYFTDKVHGDYRTTPVVKNDGQDVDYSLLTFKDSSPIKVGSVYFGDGYLLTFDIEDTSLLDSLCTMRCLTPDLTPIWEWSGEDYPIYCRGDDDRFPNVFDMGDHIIFAGCSLLFSLDKATGAERWCYQSGNCFFDMHRITDSLIIYLGKKHLHLIAPQTGKELNTIELPEDAGKLKAEYDGEYIYCFINPDTNMDTTITPHIRVYDAQSLDLINQLEMPDPYCFNGVEAPHLVDDVLYIPLNIPGIPSHALLTLTKDEVLGKIPAVLEREPRPKTEVHCIKNPDDSDHYEIDIQGDRSDWVFRYAVLDALDVVARYATSPVLPPEHNEDFNGLIKIRICGIPESERTDTFLERLARQVTKKAEDSYRSAGIHAIRAECE